MGEAKNIYFTCLNISSIKRKKKTFSPLISSLRTCETKMASGGDDWDTVTYLRKKPQSASALKSDKVTLSVRLLAYVPCLRVTSPSVIHFTKRHSCADDFCHRP